MKKFWLTLNIFLASLLALMIIYQSYAAQYYSIGNGGTTAINEWSTCYRVTNSCGPTIFVPTNSSAEWTNFINNRPGCASLSSCSYYYYRSNLTAGCDPGDTFISNDTSGYECHGGYGYYCDDCGAAVWCCYEDYFPYYYYCYHP